MSITKKIKKIKKINTSTYFNEYIRPKEWLSIPNISPNEQVIYGLHTIRPYGETVSFEFNDSVFINWGDGSEIELASLSASHTYNYNEVDIYNENVLPNGNKQVIIKIYPAEDFNLGTFAFNIANPDSQYLSKGWMDIVISAPYLTDLQFLTATYDYPYLEQFQFVGTNLLTNFEGMFQGMTNLKKIVELYTGNGAFFDNMFSDCNRLMEIPLLDLSSAINAVNMFANCNSIEFIPAFNMPLATDVSNMFGDCTNLKIVSPITFGSLLNIDTMFSYCINLKSIPFMDFSTVTTAQEAFFYCPFETIPLFDFSSLENASGMFNGCYLLTEIPAFDFTNVTNFTNIFSFDTFSSLVSFKATNIASDISFFRLPLTRDALLVIFENLTDGVTALNINIEDCLGTADLTLEDRAIAEDKGWVIID